MDLKVNVQKETVYLLLTKCHDMIMCTFKYLFENLLRIWYANTLNVVNGAEKICF